MNIRLRKFQEGGAVAPQDDPMAQLLQAAALAVQAQDCQTALLVCQVLIQMAQQQAAPAQEEAPAEEQGEPVYRAGGKLVRRIY